MPRKSPNGFNWRPPASVRVAMEESAKQNGRSLNQELTRAAMEYLRPKWKQS